MDGADAYYGVRLSDRIIETDVGIICLDAVIGRTGKQEYRFADLPQEEAEALGLQGSPADIVTLWRTEAEVFSPEFMGSLEGKPVTDGHPNRLLDPDNVLDHTRGHMQNVHRGTETLKSGDIPLLADLHITCKSLIQKIRAGLRQLSCGYTYHIALDGGRILQVDMTGNHVAVLQAGRAGAEARIYDGAPDKELPVKITSKYLLGLGLKALAGMTETTPEQLAEAATAMDGRPGPGARTIVPLTLRTGRAVVAQDGEDDEQETYTVEEVLTLMREDRKRQAGKGKGKGKGAAAADADDDRSRAHSMLDRMLDAKGKKAADEDADLESFKDELRELIEESDEDDDNAANDGADDDEDGEGMDEEDDDDDDEETRRKKKEAKDGELEESELTPVGDRPRSAFGRDSKGKGKASDKAAGMDAADVLKRLRPIVAKSKDTKLRSAFDQTLADVRKQGQTARGIRRGGAGYDAFSAGASRHAANDAADGKTEQQRLNEAYAKHHRKNPGEVTKTK